MKISYCSRRDPDSIELLKRVYSPDQHYHWLIINLHTEMWIQYDTDYVCMDESMGEGPWIDFGGMRMKKLYEGIKYTSNMNLAIKFEKEIDAVKYIVENHLGEIHIPLNYPKKDFVTGHRLYIEKGVTFRDIYI